MYRLVGNVRRRNLTTVPGKTQIKWDYMKALKKSDTSWVGVRKEENDHSLTVHRVFGFWMRTFQLLARKQKSLFCLQWDIRS